MRLRINKINVNSYITIVTENILHQVMKIRLHLRLENLKKRKKERKGMNAVVKSYEDDDGYGVTK